jgi:excisionase family DNA binding protein
VESFSTHVTADGSVIVPPRIAHWLETKAGITADWRDRLRDTDPEAHAVMVEFHAAALRHGRRSDCGTNSVVGQRQGPPLKTWIGTAEAARALNVTDRCVRKWCRSGRLPATVSGGRWLINRNDLTAYKLTA